MSLGIPGLTQTVSGGSGSPYFMAVPLYEIAPCGW